MSRHHPGPDMPNFYSLSPGGVGQITPPLGWWVTDKPNKKTKSMHGWLAYKEQQQGAISILSLHMRCTLTLYFALCTEWVEDPTSPALQQQQQQQAYTGEVCLWLFLLHGCGLSHTARLRAQHMSNTSQHTCPCITIWLLNPHQIFLEAPSLSEPHFNTFLSFFFFG